MILKLEACADAVIAGWADELGFARSELLWALEPGAACGSRSGGCERETPSERKRPPPEISRLDRDASRQQYSAE